MKKTIIGSILLLLFFFCFFISNDKEQINKTEEKISVTSKQAEESFSANKKTVSKKTIKNKEYEKDTGEVEEKINEFLTIINQEPVEFLFSIGYLDERYEDHKEKETKREKKFYGEYYEEYLASKNSETVSGIYSSITPKNFFNTLKKDKVTMHRMFFGKTIDTFGNSISFDNCFFGRHHSLSDEIDGYEINKEFRNLVCRTTGYSFLIKTFKTIKKNENEEYIDYKIESTLYNYGIYGGAETFDEMNLFGNALHVSYFFENESNGFIIN